MPESGTVPVANFTKSIACSVFGDPFTTEQTSRSKMWPSQTMTKGRSLSSMALKMRPLAD